MHNADDLEPRIGHYFRAKAAELKAQAEQVADIKKKCGRIAQLRPAAEPTQADHIFYTKEVIKSMMTGNPVPMYTLEQPKIGTAAIIFNGGEKFKAQDISQEEVEEMDNTWPDILLLLSAGKVIIKRPRDRSRT